MLDPARRPEAQDLLAHALATPMHLESDPAALSARVSDPQVVAAGLADLGRSGIAVADFALGQPSLDEVFLALTGHTAEDQTDDGDTSTVRRRGGGGRMTATSATPTVRSVISTTERPPRPSALSASLTFAWRGLLKIKHVPEQLLDVTVTPVMFTLMFTYLYGGAIAGSTGEYLQYILPGILVMAVTFTTVYSGVTINTDITKGIVDRFRSMPIPGLAPLAGPVLSDVARYLVSASVTIVLGLVLGFDPEGGVLGVVAAVALVLAFASALAWAFTALGLVMQTPQAVMNFGFTLIFPLTFLSNGFVPQDTLPNGLEDVVDLNPFTHLITATRDLMAGTSQAGDVGLVLAEAAVLTLIFAPLTVRLYRKH